jgi:hypothetical protein
MRPDSDEPADRDLRAILEMLDPMMQPDACYQKRANLRSRGLRSQRRRPRRIESGSPRLEAGSGSRPQMTPPAVPSRGRLCRPDNEEGSVLLWLRVRRAVPRRLHDSMWTLLPRLGSFGLA